MLITRSDDGYFGLRQSLSGVFSDAVAPYFRIRIKEHCVTEYGHAVALFFSPTAVSPVRFNQTENRSKNHFCQRTSTCHNSVVSVFNGRQSPAL